ncbi:hypothetical protein Curi_c22050 [Gottschalkia acidurici 9a]|uniref:Putative phage metallopeptidase domain-containing protein n=1 Tax=Gottschalkia acidurici (strain ATCC 7906 / DSM 604 / BCRC 14475 / CIP 104303 / KCTC 5404 / NCIMB 10678 / 9a) TaxID=1128398 RepID=K0AZI3_GOTA9|nr:putative metallopeptidase [Gottschalkia acidurici]AFS79208.1 hypothetical protein Curi_c22050 [Gottschalkia acidurici 9a]
MNMQKQILVVNKETEEKLEEITFNCGYNIAFTNLTDDGSIRHVRSLDNGKFGEKHWIISYIYKPIAEKLVKKYQELRHIRPTRILFIEEMDWIPPDSIKPKKHWVAKASKANKHLSSMIGYDYVMETRSYFIERISRSQIIELLCHELRQIDEYGDIASHDVED